MLDKTKLAQVLGHQLKGIMLHVDLCKRYILHQNKHCAIEHYRHTMCETKNHMLTNQLIIESLGEIVEPTKEAQIILPDDDSKLAEIWQQYERDTAAFYQQLMAEDSQTCWWKKLYDAAMKEIHHIKLF